MGQAMSPLYTSRKVERFTESVIREMTRLINQFHPDDGVNLAQGFPDFAAPREIKEAACAAILDDVNQYAITWGTAPLRNAIARKTAQAWGRAIDPEREITVCCGATETMIASIMATLNPDDEVVIFSPFYENYGPDCILAGARPRFVPLRAPDWTFDPDELAAAFTPRTRGIIVNTPHNPTGKVFSRQELELIASLCIRHDALAFTDEIYEHMVYDGEHISLATLDGMAERTITISGLSKTFSVTGWRLGYAIAPPAISDAIRKVHDFLTVGAPHPLQAAAAVALALGDDYYASLLSDYRARRDYLVPRLAAAGFVPYQPAGAYYVMTDISTFGVPGDVAFTRYLVKEIGLAVVPGSSFFPSPAEGASFVRFAFPKKMSTLERAAGLLARIERR
ncbi:MAG: aminotransferase class [Chloroflexi bacterium]|nr:aminotransferase class [Chloroflexota bacterium]